jgi:hypothetical protein
MNAIGESGGSSPLSAAEEFVKTAPGIGRPGATRALPFSIDEEFRLRPEIVAVVSSFLVDDRVFYRFRAVESPPRRME